MATDQALIRVKRKAISALLLPVWFEKQDSRSWGAFG